MPISNDTQLAAASAKASELIHEIQRYVGDRNCDEAKIAFPYGFIRSAAKFRSGLMFIGDYNLRTNIAYSLILGDYFRWSLNRTKIVGIAREMLVKQIICNVGTICESITKHYLHGKITGQKGYKKRTEKLVHMGAIDRALQTELDWVWDTRQNEHLFLVGEREYQKYAVKDSNRAVRALKGLRDSLATYHAAKPLTTQSR
jgi:hypothetical protein